MTNKEIRKDIIWTIHKAIKQELEASGYHYIIDVEHTEWESGLTEVVITTIQNEHLVIDSEMFK